MTDELERLSVTLPSSLREDVDDIVEESDYDSRSEAIRDALRAFVTDYDNQTGLSGTLSGTVVVLYDHDHGAVTDRMTALQHEFEEAITAVHHVHLSNHHCLESIAVDGPGERIEELLNRVRPLEGVLRVELAVMQTGR